jgi:hypothetical protein
MAHTPGNWTINHECIGPPGEPVALLCDMTAPNVATVVDWPRRDAEAVDDTENEANARLIAAAPELLAALEEVLGLASQAHSDCEWENDTRCDAEGYGDGNVDEHLILRNTIAAIAKATGELE